MDHIAWREKRLYAREEGEIDDDHHQKRAQHCEHRQQLTLVVNVHCFCELREAHGTANLNPSRGRARQVRRISRFAGGEQFVCDGKTRSTVVHARAKQSLREALELCGQVCRRSNLALVTSIFQAVTPRVLSAELLLHAYRNAVFPMAMDDGEIAWFSPDPRAIIPLDGFHVPHGLRRTLKKRTFEVRVNTAFVEVLQACSTRDETWINAEIIRSYTNLHELGHAHSVESWHEGQLVGGLYGVAIGGAFFGESMFHRATDASKVALHALVERLRAREFTLLDTQWTTPHLLNFGAVEVPRAVYRQLLENALTLPCRFAD